MSWNTITRKPADVLFSNWLREQRGWKCEKCGRVCKVGSDWLCSLQASHYFSRGHGGTRFDPLNVYSLCGSCHKRMGGYKPSEDGEYDLFVKERLGEKEYTKLKIRAKGYHRNDDKLNLLYVKQLVKTQLP